MIGDNAFNCWKLPAERLKVGDNQQPRRSVTDLVIYSITNLVNGKQYVGQTSQGLKHRKAEHICRFNLGERNHKLYLAMRKYGLSNFKFEELCCVLKPKYLDAVEIEFIEKFNSFRRGYNMTCGGDSVSDETKAKIKAALTGRKITWYDKVVASRKERRAKYGPLKRTVVGGLCSNSKSYLIRTPDGAEIRVKGIRQFCRDNSLDHSTLFAVLAGKQRHHKGYSLIARFND
jgi:hypothetical protein